MNRLVVATLNPGKIRELGEALAGEGLEVVGLDQVEDRTPVEETGATFEDNARLKAEAYSLRTGLPVVADDSGLEVDALDGAPGVKSARYGGPELDDAGRCRALLDALQGVPEARRTARFRCVLAVGLAGKIMAVFDGEVPGRILETPRGEDGFGYDPVFFHEPSGRSFAELTTERKQAVSHRGQAIRAFLESLRMGHLQRAGLG